MAFPKSQISRLQQLVTRWQQSQRKSRRKPVSKSPTPVTGRAKTRSSKAPPAIEPQNTNRRMVAVWVILGLSAIGLLVRLFFLQVIEGSRLEQKAQARQEVLLRPFVPRRPIVDRHQNYLAIDRPSYTIYAHPQNFKRLDKSGIKILSPAEVARDLAPILQVQEADLLARFQKQKSGILLGHNFSEGIENRIKALKNDGLDIRQEEHDYTRIYPHNEMAAEILGYLDLKHRAQAGVEYSQASLLERQVREYWVTRTQKGDILPDRVTPELLHNDDLQLQLTIDLRLQQAARVALKEQMKAWNAVQGTVIVMEADTGALRALVVEPTYNPNEYSKYPIDRFKNWAVADLYEPGSTFKPINVAIALENKVISPSSTFNDTGMIKVGPDIIRNADKKGNGRINIAEILQHSSNIGMVEMMNKLKPSVFYDWLQKLGLGQKTGIDLPFEARSTLKNRRDFLSRPIEPATAAFGQGFSLTPIQLVTLTSTIANGGKLVTPYVVEGLFDRHGNRQDRLNRPEPTQIFSRQNTQAVLEMMETVVDRGTGMNAKIAGYRIAGKTGTAQKASSQGGYREKAKITSFVGILPVDAQRRYVVFAAVDEPRGKTPAYGSTVAAPIVKSVMEATIHIEGLPPSDPSAVKAQK
jgi:cell division protein FtsI (penicillin-binding protein 3)